MSPKQRDIAISVAEEDLQVAQEIAIALNEKNISYYLYTEHRAKNWGQHILKISIDAFGADAKYVLMITSRIYAEKYWSNIERQIAHILQKDKEPYILQLRLDDTPIDGLKNIVWEDWKNNAIEISEVLKEKLKLRVSNRFERNDNKAPKLDSEYLRPVLLLISTITGLFLGGLYYEKFSSHRNKLQYPQTDTPIVNQKSITKTDIDTSQIEIYSSRCQAITKKGTQCKRTVKSGKYCWQHER
jgi:hypothetical protein